ncbi:high affinity cationic amino acid transporter 1-like isoform X2 [Cimex lectularius]|uniref:Cationic amino acid transporter C-terminal domain-containing protein n=1 Tax=Cimex lectularius TaxID=79782 RepID=A0A8I6S0W8_CIMLE|nr:high affinity cationic amino acid transporter 1-like isoform X2 [Cimex lectularius]
MVHLKRDLHRIVSKFGSVVSRKKTDDTDASLEGSHLARVLGFGDLTLLGVGSTLGVGVYVLAGSVARTDAGPAVTLSFLVAAIASSLAGLCYAEFAARVPKAGSAYVYSYVTVGELAAFVIGWNLILEYVIGTASVARAFSAYLDQMFGKVIASTLTEVMPLHVDFLSPYPDFLSLGIVLLLTGFFPIFIFQYNSYFNIKFVHIVLLAYGVKESALLNNIFTALNLLTVVTVIIAGLFKVDSYNWAIPKSAIPAKDKGGEGGFMPYGISGVMAGAAKCFFGFVGFDCVATTGEEAKNPQKHIPLAIIFSMLIIFSSYFGISTVLTMMIPYFEQDLDAPLVSAFEITGMPVISKIVSIGAIFALCTSLLGCMFPAPRLLYSMGKDKTLWNFLAIISYRTQTPLRATFVAGGITGIMAALFNLEQLIDMMSIGTLLAYTIVALCVLLLRYRDPKPALYEPSTHNTDEISWSHSMSNLVNRRGMTTPDKTTTAVSEAATISFIVLTFITTLLIVNFEDEIGKGNMGPVYIILCFVVLLCLPVIIIAFQPQDNPSLFFKVPLIPLLPCISIFINMYLMMKLDMHTWIRFGVWLILGGLIYIFYSIPNSVEGNKEKLAKQMENIRK